MSTHGSPNRVRLTGAALAVCLTNVVAAPPAAAQDTFAGPVLVMERASLDRLLAHEKDLALAHALAMLPARVAELPSEGGARPVLAETIQMLLPALAHPARLTVAYDPEAEGGALGYGVAVSLQLADEAEAGRLHEHIRILLSAAPRGPRARPSERIRGMLDMPTPAGMLSLGPRQARDGWRYEVIFGTMSDPDIGAEMLPPEPEHVMETLLRAHLNVAGLRPLVDLATLFAGQSPELTELRRRLETWGLIGPQAMTLSLVVGRTPTALTAVGTVHGAGAHALALGLPRTPLSRTDLTVIPADAVFASIWRLTDNWPAQFLEQIRSDPEASASLADVLERFRAATDVDLETEVLGTLGSTGMLYMAQATGGGGLTSMVGLIEVVQRDRLAGVLERLADRANDAAARHVRGHVRVSHWRHGDVDLWSLRFPGLPVPLELSASLTPRWLVLGLTPQAVIAAVRHASGRGDGGLTSRASLAAVITPNAEPISVTWFDAAAYLPQGYAIVSLAGSAVANLVRSPADPARDPGLVIPLYSDFARDTQPCVSYSHWHGNDLVITVSADPSVLVNVAGIAGALMRHVPEIAIPAAAAGAIGER